MSRKRSLMPDIYKNRKRICAGPRQQQNNAWEGHDKIDDNVLPCETKVGLLYLKDLFPVEKFEGRLPPIILRSQLYSIVKNRTKVDRELGDLRTNGEVRLFKLGSEEDEFCVVFTADYKSHVLSCTTDASFNRAVIGRFLSDVLSRSQDISFNKQAMMQQFHFTDEEITQLVKAGVLTVRDVGSWWISVPFIGTFVKTFIRGRKAVLTMIRKCKYKEILQVDLEKRKLPKAARLGILYHIHDIIGADLVQCIQTTSGQLLRLLES